MKFTFELKKYFTSERSLAKSFFHEKINFICSSQRVVSFYYIDMSVSKIKNKKIEEKQRKNKGMTSAIS